MGLVVVLLAAGCGDPLLCKSDVFVALQTTTIASDLDLAPGVQGDLHVKTSLDEGESVELAILDADGNVSSTTSSLVDAGGEATIRATFPPPRVTVRATAIGRCGEGTDEATVDILAGAGCELAFDPTPATSAFYAPLGVFTAASDMNSVIAGLQTQVRVATRADWSVDLYVASSAGESLVASTPTTNGFASLVATLPDGNVTVRAVCHDATSSTQIPSVASPVFVDTGAPSCDITSPVAGSTITPVFDLDHDLTNGVQLDVGIGGVGTGDLQGEAFTLAVTEQGSGTTMIGGTIDNSNAGAASVTLAPVVTPATFTFALSTHDHAGNACGTMHDYTVVLDGCDIAIDPLAVVTADADGNATNGAQLDLSVTVAAACIGRTVTSSCGFDSPIGVVPASGPLTLRETVCATSTCETSATCIVGVTTASGVATSASATVQFDNAAPVVSVAVTSPTLPCGSQVTPANDIDPVLDGVQVIVQVAATGTVTSKSLAQTTPGGMQTFDASTTVELTIAPGINTLVGSASDPDGNLGQSPACTLTLSDLSVSFSAPAADGSVGRQDGTVSGTNLTFPLCGTVNRTGTTVTVAVDGGAPQAATVIGTQWCHTITLAESPPNHTIIARATSGTSLGAASLVLAVDLTRPGAISGFVASVANRAAIAASWVAAADSGHAADHYVIRVATSALTNANFDSTGMVVPGPTPKAPGSAEQYDIPIRPKATVWVGVAAADVAGNRGTASVAGPFTLDFTATGAITAQPASQGNLELGIAIAAGKFNDDEFVDLAVGAPTRDTAGGTGGAVYVYFGSPTGISATPGLVITGAVAAGRVGTSLAAVRWSSTTRDDLVVGAPGIDGGSGRLLVFAGGATFGSGTRVATTATNQLSVNATNNALTKSGLGNALATVDLDGDGILDLAIGAPGNATGRAVFVYGPITADVSLSSISVANAVVEILTDPNAVSAHRLATFLFAVGPRDVVVGYDDNTTTAGDSLYVLRGNGVRPALGVHTRAFTVGRDVRIDLVTASTDSEWGSQATSIADQNGDGVRDLVIGASANAGNGQVFIIDGATLGTSGAAKTSDAGVVLTTLTGTTPNGRFGAAIVANDGISDIDLDGREDLLIIGLAGTTPVLFGWYGGAIPIGATTTATAMYKRAGPSAFAFPASTGMIAVASWIGDVDGDGLPDVCWTSPLGNSLDGSFEVLR